MQGNHRQEGISRAAIREGCKRGGGEPEKGLKTLDRITYRSARPTSGASSSPEKGQLGTDESERDGSNVSTEVLSPHREFFWGLREGGKGKKLQSQEKFSYPVLVLERRSKSKDHGTKGKRK